MLAFVPIVTVCAYSIDDIRQQFNYNKWYTGKNLKPGDFFVYNVCDDTSHLTVDQGCYTIRMDFYALMQSENREVWIVQAEIHLEDDITQHHIFVIDSDTMNVHTISSNARPHARSIQDTVLFIAEFATKQSPKQLAIGQIWGYLQSINPDAAMIVASQNAVTIQDQDIDVFVIQYDFFETSVFMIHRDIAFPVYAVFYDPYWPLADPPIRFTFELIASSYTEQMSNKHTSNALSR